MAQHPFGPIENQLIVGYYKRVKDPSNAKISFKFKDVLADTELHHPLIAGLQPVFYGWSPANGNSSSHDFQFEVTYNGDHGEEHLLRSRGLGYRITFTMPDKPLAGKKKQQQGMLCQYAIVDIFGEKVLSETSTFVNSEEELYESTRQNFAGKWKKLELESTPLHFKLIEDSTKEFKITAFQPAEGPRVERSREESFGLQYLWGREDDKEYSGLFLAKHLSIMIAYLDREHNLMEADTKTRIREHVLFLIRTFAELCRLMVQNRTEKDPGYQAYQQFAKLGLFNKVEAWFDGKGAYPLDISTDLIIGIFEEIRDNQDPNERSVNYFEKAIPAPYDLETLAFILPMAANDALNHILIFEPGKADHLPFLHQMPTTKFALKNYTLEYDQSFGNAQQHRFFASKKTGPGFTLFPKGKSATDLKDSRIEIIPGTDLLLGYPWSFDPGHCYYLVDVAATHERRQKRNQTTVFRRIDTPASMEFVECSLFACAKGITLLAYPDREDPNAVSLHHHCFSQKSGRWASLDLLQILGGQKFSSIGSAMQAKQTHLLYAVIHLPKGSGSYFQRKLPGSEPDLFHFLCVQYCATDNQLKIVHHNSLPATFDEHLTNYRRVTWLQKSKFVFAVILSCSLPKIWVAVNMKSSFVAVASKTKNQLEHIDLSKRFAQLCPMTGVNNLFGVIGVSKPKRTSDGKDLYRVGRLRVGF